MNATANESPQIAITSTANPVENTTDHSTWQEIASGLEQRIFIPEAGEFLQMTALRIDPTRYQFRAHYRSGNPLGLNDWLEELPEPVALINANFFDPQNQVLGLLISDGQRFGTSYQNRGGTFAIQDNLPIVRSNRLQPYAGEPFQQAVQAFPMLVLNGQQAYQNSRDTWRSRRTLIGQDEQGRIILMATPGFGMGLFELSAYLPITDIGFVNAFNLDGGGSTMMWIAPSETQIFSFDPVPAVLAVYPMEE